MNFKKRVQSVQTAGYNGASTVVHIYSPLVFKIQSEKASKRHFRWHFVVFLGFWAQKPKNTRKSNRKLMSFRCLFKVFWNKFWRWGGGKSVCFSFQDYVFLRLLSHQTWSRALTQKSLLKLFTIWSGKFWIQERETICGLPNTLTNLALLELSCTLAIKALFSLFSSIC